MNAISKIMMTAALVAAGAMSVSAENADSTCCNKKSRFSVGGYGEVALTRNFYSDNVYRYRAGSNDKYRDDPSHGRFDIPHVVIYLNYDFGKGWTMGSEIEFEHGGTGNAWEAEYGEGGELEQESERGGEVELEQFWLQKSFSPAANIRIGHIVVPVGLNNSAHEPLNFFTVYRPEGENTILPSTWHQTGISFWGRCRDWRYELQLVAGLDAMYFTSENWIQGGKQSAFEFDAANKYGVAARIDNYSIPGLRLGLSGYYGQSINNTNTTSTSDKVKKLKGDILIGSFDFTYKDHNWIARGNFDYGHLGDAANVVNLPYRGVSPYSSGDVSPKAIATGVEAGYDIFSQIQRTRRANEKMYIFGRYEYYNSYMGDIGGYDYCKKHRFAAGINYFPIPQLVIKAEYSKRLLDSKYMNEPSISLGVAYQGFFL